MKVTTILLAVVVICSMHNAPAKPTGERKVVNNQQFCEYIHYGRHGAWHKFWVSCK